MIARLPTGSPLGDLNSRSLFVVQPLARSPRSPQRAAFASPLPPGRGVLRLLAAKSFQPPSFWRGLGVSSGVHLMAGLLMVVSPFVRFPWAITRPAAMEFTLVAVAAPTPPQKASFLGERHQQAASRKTPEKPPQAEQPPANALAPIPPPEAVSPPAPTMAPPASPPPMPVEPPPMPPSPTSHTPPQPPAIAQAAPSPPEKAPAPEGPVLMTSLTDPALRAVDPAMPDTLSPTEAAADSERHPAQALTPEAGPSQADAVAVRASDFAPWMGQFKRRLSRHWVPPRGEQRRKVTLLIDVARDGTVSGIRVDQSSGERRSDEAAMEAVRMSAPFAPLPEAYTAPSVPILFTFDYTVVGDRRRP